MGQGVHSSSSSRNTCNSGALADITGQSVSQSKALAVLNRLEEEEVGGKEVGRVENFIMRKTARDREISASAVCCLWCGGLS